MMASLVMDGRKGSSVLTRSHKGSMIIHTNHTRAEDVL